jgi:hypothetical protein
MIGHDHERFDGLFVKVTTFEHVRRAAFADSEGT